MARGVPRRRRRKNAGLEPGPASTPGKLPGVQIVYLGELEALASPIARQTRAGVSGMSR